MERLCYQINLRLKQDKKGKQTTSTEPLEEMTGLYTMNTDASHLSTRKSALL